MRYRIAQFLFILPLILFSTTGYSKPDVWKLWKQPGVHAIMRHTTAPGFGDPENFTLGKCDTQRNLNEVGRQEARAGPKRKSALRDTSGQHHGFDRGVSSIGTNCSFQAG